MGSHEDEFGVASPPSSATPVDRYAPPPPPPPPVRPAMAPIDVNAILAETLAPLLPEGYVPDALGAAHSSRHAAPVAHTLPAEVAEILSPDLREKLERENRDRQELALRAVAAPLTPLDVPTVLASQAGLSSALGGAVPSPVGSVQPKTSQLTPAPAPVTGQVPNPSAPVTLTAIAAEAMAAAPILTRREARKLTLKEDRREAKRLKRERRQAASVREEIALPEEVIVPAVLEARPLRSRVAASEVTKPEVPRDVPAKVATSARASSRPVVVAKKLKSSPSTRPASQSEDPSRRRTGRMVTMVSMAFIAGLAVATSVPANALLTPQDLQARSLGISTEDAAGQEVLAGDSASVTGRDKVSSTLYDGRTGFISGVTYVNNPAGKIQWPIRVTVPMSDLYGTRPDPFGGGGTVFHHGIDFNPGIGFPIQAIADGVVVGIFQEEYSSLGYHVIIEHNIKGQKVWSVYAHLKEGSIQVKLGQRVQVTDIVGQCGDSGYSTGAHLHFEIRLDDINGYTDPLAWLRANAK